MNVEQATAVLKAPKVSNHPFLSNMRSGQLSNSQLKKFGIQWYKAATAHKKSFPGLIYNTENDIVRFDLIHILRDEYGNGNSDDIHAHMLLRFLYSLGLTDQEIRDSYTIPKIKKFSNSVNTVWISGDPIKAFGVHYSLEVLAADMHLCFFDGINQASGADVLDLQYFKYHSVAEIEHADVSDRGFNIYCEDPNNHQKLSAGIFEGIQIIRLLWDGLNEHVFHA